MSASLRLRGLPHPLPMRPAAGESRYSTWFRAVLHGVSKNDPFVISTQNMDDYINDWEAGREGAGAAGRVGGEEEGCPDSGSVSL